MKQVHPLLLAGALLLAAAAPAAAQSAFDPAMNLPAGTQPSSSVLADLEGDGDLDLAVATDLPDRILLFFNDGTGSFGAAVPVFLGGGTSPQSVVASDLDGDGDQDLAVSLKNVNAVQVITNAGGVFTPGATFPVGIEPRFLDAADLNGDGRDDLATANRTSGTVSVLLNNGAGSFGGATSLPAGLDTRGLELADLDGDGDLDVAASSHGTRQLILHFNNGNGSFGASTALSVGAQLRPDGVVAADLDGDGDQDLAAATSGNAFNFVSVFTNNAGVFAGPANFATGGVNPGPIVAADFDLDGDTDLATGNQDSGSVAVLDNTGAAAFGAPLLLAAGSTPDALALGDADGNGSEDLFATNRDSNNVSFFRNQASAALVLEPIVPGTAGMVNTVTITGATPFAVVPVAVSPQAGMTPAAGCPGVFWGLRNARVKANPAADALGNVVFSKMVPGRFAGRTLLIQALDNGSCRLSNVVAETF